MASVSRKYKEAQERWIQHCHDIERSTAKIPKGTEQERKDRIARARKDYRYFVRTYFSPPCDDRVRGLPGRCRDLHAGP